MTKIKRIQLLKIGITSITLLVFLLSTDPSKLSVGLLFVPVVLVFLVVYFTTQLFIDLSHLKLNPQKRRILSMLCAATPTLGILLKSIDQLTIKDITLMLVLVLAGSFYVSILRFGKVVE